MDGDSSTQDGRRPAMPAALVVDAQIAAEQRRGVLSFAEACDVAAEAMRQRLRDEQDQLAQEDRQARDLEYCRECPHCTGPEPAAEASESQSAPRSQGGSPVSTGEPAEARWARFRSWFGAAIPPAVGLSDPVSPDVPHIDPAEGHT